MKTIDASQFAANVDQYLSDSRAEVIVVTRGGRPCAVIQGLDYDDEQIELVNSPEFWSMIRERREQPTISGDVVKQRLDALEK